MIWTLCSLSDVIFLLNVRWGWSVNCYYDYLSFIRWGIMTGIVSVVCWNNWCVMRLRRLNFIPVEAWDCSEIIFVFSNGGIRSSPRDSFKILLDSLKFNGVLWFLYWQSFNIHKKIENFISNRNLINILARHSFILASIQL